MINLNKKDPIADAVKEILQQEALKGGQKEIDKNHNNKIDGGDFKILRGEKKAVKKEEVEIVYEANIQPTSAKSRSHIGNLSNPTVNSVEHSGKQIGLITKQSDGQYHAHHSAAKLAHAAGGTFDSKDKAHQFIRNAHAKAIKSGTLSDRFLKKEEVQTVEEGIKDVAKKAFKALTGGSDEDQRKDLQRKMGVPQTGKKPTQKEEVEQIDELSKSTLGSYVKKANNSTRDAAMNLGYKAGRKEGGVEFTGTLSKRRAGVERAADKLTKEEVNTQKTLKQFRENAFDWKKKPEPTPNGGSGVKQGSRYGGSKQKDKPEQDTDEKK